MHFLSPSIAQRFASFVTAARDRRGVAVMEFALVAPVLAVLALGVLNYGQYFLLAHSTQQIANDAARATIAGLNETERDSLAKALVAKEIAQLPNVKPGQYSVKVDEAATPLVKVTVRLDASANAMFAMKMIPMPDAVIERSGTVRQGGLE